MHCVGGPHVMVSSCYGLDYPFRLDSTSWPMMAIQAPAIIFHSSQQNSGRRTEEKCGPFLRRPPKMYLCYLCLHPNRQNLVTWPQLASMKEVFISGGCATSWKSGVPLQRKKWELYWERPLKCFGEVVWHGKSGLAQPEKLLWIHASTHSSYLGNMSPAPNATWGQRSLRPS